MKFLVAFRVLSRSILSGLLPLGVTSLRAKSSSQKKKRKALEKEVWPLLRQSPRLRRRVVTQRSHSPDDLSPVTLDHQLSSVLHRGEPTSPDLLEDTQRSIIPGTEVPPLPAIPAVARARSQDSSYEDDYESSSEDDQTPVGEKTPTKTTGEDNEQSDLEIEMGHQTESPFKTDFCFGQFDGEYDMAAEDYTFHERVMHHLGGRRIDQNNRLAVELVCILETGTIVTDKHTMDSQEIDVHFEEEYVKIIDAFKPEDFQERSLQSVMRHKLYRANKPLQGHRLRKKFREIRAEIRAEWIPLLPTNVSQIASGNQLRDMYKKLIIKMYRISNVSNNL